MKTTPLRPVEEPSATIILTLSPNRTEPAQRELRPSPRRNVRAARPAGDGCASDRVVRLWLG